MNPLNFNVFFFVLFFFYNISNLGRPCWVLMIGIPHCSLLSRYQPRCRGLGTSRIEKRKLVTRVDNQVIALMRAHGRHIYVLS